MAFSDISSRWYALTVDSASFLQLFFRNLEFKKSLPRRLPSSSLYLWCHGLFNFEGSGSFTVLEKYKYLCLQNAYIQPHKVHG